MYATATPEFRDRLRAAVERHTTEVIATEALCRPATIDAVLHGAEVLRATLDALAWALDHLDAVASAA